MVEHTYSEIKKQWKKCEPCKKIKSRVEMAGKRPLIFYGAGRLAGVFLDVCNEMKIEVSGICDSYAKGKYKELDVISQEVLCEKYPDALILICLHTYNREIYTKLRNIGYEEEQIISCPIKFPYFTSPKEFAAHLEGYKWAYDFFEDAISKQLVLDRMKMYLLDEPVGVNTASECYYEKELISLTNKEVFVDAGAYTGDTAEDFIKKVDEKYNMVYFFEPSPVNYKKAVERLCKYKKIEPFQKGLWSKEEVLEFMEDSANMAGSCLKAGSSEISVFVTSLDEVFAHKEKEEFPTFIKMDIEGSEKEALIGATKIIREKKPKLAICAYHKVEDVYELPLIIQMLRADYKFVLRQHYEGCFDMVLYAV